MHTNIYTQYIYTYIYWSRKDLYIYIYACVKVGMYTCIRRCVCKRIYCELCCNVSLPNESIQTPVRQLNYLHRRPTGRPGPQRDRPATTLGRPPKQVRGGRRRPLLCLRCRRRRPGVVSQSLPGFAASKSSVAIFRRRYLRVQRSTEQTHVLLLSIAVCHRLRRCYRSTSFFSRASCIPLYILTYDTYIYIILM